MLLLRRRTRLPGGGGNVTDLSVLHHSQRTPAPDFTLALIKHTCMSSDPHHHTLLKHTPHLSQVSDLAYTKWTHTYTTQLPRHPRVPGKKTIISISFNFQYTSRYVLTILHCLPDCWIQMYITVLFHILRVWSTSRNNFEHKIEQFLSLKKFSYYLCSIVNNILSHVNWKSFTFHFIQIF